MRLWYNAAILVYREEASMGHTTRGFHEAVLVAQKGCGIPLKPSAASIFD